MARATIRGRGRGYQLLAGPAALLTGRGRATVRGGAAEQAGSLPAIEANQAHSPPTGRGRASVRGGRGGQASVGSPSSPGGYPWEERETDASSGEELGGRDLDEASVVQLRPTKEKVVCARPGRYLVQDLEDGSLTYLLVTNW